MPTKYRDEDDEEDEAALHDWEAPDESDADDEEDDGPQTVPCPYCGNRVSELAEICPHCRSFISDEDAPRRRPWWFVAAAVACLLAVLLFWVL